MNISQPDLYFVRHWCSYGNMGWTSLSVKRIFESSECVGEESLSNIGETVEEASFLEVGAEEYLTPSQAKIYVTLISKGPLTFESISKMLKIDLSDVCRAILRLQKRGFVSVGDVLPIIRSVKW